MTGSFEKYKKSLDDQICKLYMREIDNVDTPV